jgi:hypothetical protein
MRAQLNTLAWSPIPLARICHAEIKKEPNIWNNSGGEPMENRHRFHKFFWTFRKQGLLPWLFCLMTTETSLDGVKTVVPYAELNVTNEIMSPMKVLKIRNEQLPTSYYLKLTWGAQTNYEDQQFCWKCKYKCTHCFFKDDISFHA